MIKEKVLSVQNFLSMENIPQEGRRNKDTFREKTLTEYAMDSAILQERLKDVLQEMQGGLRVNDAMGNSKGPSPHKSSEYIGKKLSRINS